MQKYSALIILLFCLTSCLSKKDVALHDPNWKGGASSPASASSSPSPPPVLPSDEVPLPRSSTAEAYIARYKNIAIQEMNQYGIPASIKLAQALLESGNGNSSLARNANNHFGIKSTSSWQGKSVLKADDHPDDRFRVYNTPEESFRDHSQFLLRKRYAALFELDRDDYKGWARGLKRAGYATNPRYAELLINLIERYNLQQYDRSETPTEKIHREEVVLAEVVKEAPEEEKKEMAKPPVAMSIHEVRSGDTLLAISKTYSISVEDIKILNGLNGDSLTPGQLLLVSK